MTVADLIGVLGEKFQVVGGPGGLDVPVTSVTDDSRKVSPGALFVAVKGGQVDGHEFVEQAVSAGASALVLQDEGGAATSSWRVGARSLPLIRVKDSRGALGLLAGRFYGDPSSRLRMIGVTGTNGKTTVTYLCKAILEAGSRKVGLIGTVAYLVGTERLPASHTTPGPVEFHELLSRMVQGGLDSVVMEVSSHALAMDRTAGCEFDVAVFTNLTQDHLDFHANMEEYFHAKLRLFTGLSPDGVKTGPKRAIVNIDDPRGARVRQHAKASVWTYSIRSPSDIRAEHINLSLGGTNFLAVTPAGRMKIESQLVGEHNVYNMLAAIGVGLQEGLPLETIQTGLRSVGNIPGRFERVEGAEDYTVVVDYAHTEDALDRLLAAARVLKTGRIITVFGCGGDRDRSKRPKMGRVATRHSDVVFLTSDNPRTEDPLAILGEVERGVREELDRSARAPFRYEVIPDRRLAIEAALREARRGDMVLIAGKGHEDYQIIGTKRYHFDDREVARAALQGARR